MRMKDRARTRRRCAVVRLYSYLAVDRELARLAVRRAGDQASATRKRIDSDMDHG